MDRSYLFLCLWLIVSQRANVKLVVDLFFNRSTNGASVSTSAATDASFGIDNEDAIAFCDSVNRAAFSASAAGDAFVCDLKYCLHDNTSIFMRIITALSNNIYYIVLFQNRQVVFENFFNYSWFLGCSAFEPSLSRLDLCLFFLKFSCLGSFSC